MKYPLFILLLFLGLLLAGCQATILDPAQPLPFPPVWQGGDNPASYLMAATYHTAWLVNQVGADETAYRAQLAAWGLPVTESEYVWLRHVDLDDDGQQEVLLTYPLVYKTSGAVDAVSVCLLSDCRRIIFLFEEKDGFYWPPIAFCRG